jgi:hypothetical protein
MQSSRRPARMRLLPILLSATLACALSACASRPQVFLNASPCADLVPGELIEDTPSAHPPVSGDQGAWVAFGDAQTGQLDKANLKPHAIMHIVSGCEARDRETAKKLQAPPVWQFWHWFG